MAPRHCQPSVLCLHSSTNLCPRREFFCSCGLKEVVLIFDDVENRVFRSTHKATHSLIASIGARVWPALHGSAHLHSEAERMVHSEIGDDAQEGSVCFPVDVGCGMEQNSSCRAYCDVPTSNDSQPHLGEYDGFDSSILWMRSQPGSSLLHSSKSLPSLHAATPSQFPSSGEINVPRTPGLHKSYLEAQESCGVSESCLEHPEAPSTLDLQLEFKFRDCEGLHNEGVKGQPCAVSEFFNKNIEGDCLILEENGIMPACKSTCHDAPESEVFCTDDEPLTGPSYSSFDCSEGANSNSSLQTLNFKIRKLTRVVLDYLDTLTLGISEITHRQKLCFEALPTSHLRRTLQKLVRLLRKESSGGGATLFSEESMTLMHLYVRLYKPRHILAQGGRARAASSFSRRTIYLQETLVENAHARRDGPYKKVNWLILVQCHQRCFFRERRNVSSMGLLLKGAISTVDEAGQCDTMPSLSNDTDSVSRSPYLLEEGFPRCTESSSETLDGFQVLPEVLQIYLESKDTFESDTSSHSVSSKMSSASASKVLNLLEIRDGHSTNGTETSSIKMAELKEEPMDSSEFQSLSSVNKIDDWSSLPADQVDKCLDTRHSHPQHYTTCSPCDFTPEVRLLEPAPSEMPSKPANSSKDSLVEEGLQSILYANGNETSASCFPDAGPFSHTPSQCTSSVSSTREELQIFMPYTRVHERPHNKERLEHFAEGFLLRRHITRQQQRAQLAPPFPPRDSAGYAWNDQRLRGKRLEQVKVNPYTLCSTKASTPNSRELGMTLISSAKPCDVADCYGHGDRLLGADVVVDIVGLMDYIESQCSQPKTFTDAPTNSTNYTDMHMIGGRTVISNFSTMIVTIIAIVLYTKTLLEGGLARVGARTQKEESK